MTNNKIAEDYKVFVGRLYECISHEKDITNIAQLILVDSYCKYICNKVAFKYHVDGAEVHAQLVLEVLENKVLPNIINGSQTFSGRYFQYRIINIAKRLLPHETEELSETTTDNTDIALNVIENLSSISQLSGFNHLKQAKIKELEAFKHKISSSQKINLDELGNILELSIEAIARKLDLPRHKLMRHSSQYKALLHGLLDEYIGLVDRWFDIRYTYLNKLAEEHGSLIKVYQRISLNYSYSKFAELANSMNLWQLEEIRLQLER